MASKAQKAPDRRTELSYDAISIEGGLVSPDFLSLIARQEAGYQSEADYRVPKGLKLRDEIARYWQMALAEWADFKAHQDAFQFVPSLLKKVFGFDSLRVCEPPLVKDRRYPITLAALTERVPVLVAPSELGLEKPSEEFGDEGRRRHAFGLMQEYLNAEDAAVWGVVSDGLTLRIARDNQSLTRPAWIEVDLQRIFAEQRYPDFTVLWLLLHESRFDSALESWRKKGEEQGTRVRDALRGGVEKALLVLGSGFLQHPKNDALRKAMASGLTKDTYFQELLRVVYRLIFLLTVEERAQLHPPGTDERTQRLYLQGYSVRRLVARAPKRSAHDRFSDLWEGLRIVFEGLADGEPKLGLPALAGIFARSQCSHVDVEQLENKDLLLAIFHLAWHRDQDTQTLTRVNWRDMGPEELGSVYESLLELVPVLPFGGREFSFAQGRETKGNARKTTGSYYTPSSLVQVLLDSTLEPVVSETVAKHPDDPVSALLRLSVVDPACGSGHFLLAAAWRLAGHVARLRAHGTPSNEQLQHSLREVVGRCIYGVDLNPMAVELCRVSLWMLAVEPGKPLTFLNSHIQQGNALLGSTPCLLAKGIPDAAWEPIEGDDRQTTQALKRRNRAERDDANASFTFAEGIEDGTLTLTEHAQIIDLQPDESLEGLERKEASWRSFLQLRQYKARRLAADAWCAAFVWRREPGELASIAPTHNEWERLRHDPEAAPRRMVEEVERLASGYHFFHWHLQFPQVFAKGGFDVVLGNPPWERVKLQEQEFFASRSEEIANAVNAAARKKLIAKLPDENPHLWLEWSAASRKAEGESHFIRQSGRYPLCGKGDVNTYAIFAEHNRTVLNSRGRAGFIVPTGIATDDTTKEYFSSLVNERELVCFYSFENEEFVFPGVHHAFRFALLTVGFGGSARVADLVFFARQVAALADPERHVSLAPADFETLNPNTRTCPTFRSRRDADINLAMYRRAGVLWREADEENGNPWNLRFLRMFDMSNDSGLFRTRADLEASNARLESNRFVEQGGKFLPLVEAKMVHIFDHRFGTYEGQTTAQGNQGKLPEFDSSAHADTERLTHPYYWVAESEVSERLSGRWEREWIIGWRDICRSTDQRTIISSLIPRAATADTFLLALPNVEPTLAACFYASLCAFATDYAARQKVGGTHLKYHTFKQLPVLPPSTYEAPAPWDRSTTLAAWILPRVVELTYTAADLRSFARDVGFDSPPFEWRPQRRFELRCELDAAFFRLYGLSKEDVAYVMETFPIVRRNEEKTHDGVYRTKAAIIGIYDELVAAERTETPYRTRLSPPPADTTITQGVPGRNVLPFRSVTSRPLAGAELTPRLAIPAWSSDLLQAVATKTGIAASAGRWGTTLTGLDLGIAALAAVLRNTSGPSSRDEVERAVVLSVLPRLLQSKFDARTAPKWRRAIGTANMDLASIETLAISWTEVLRRAAVEHLLVVDADERWRAGADIDDAPSDVLDARALVALSWLQSTSGAAVEDIELVTQLGVLRAA